MLSGFSINFNKSELYPIALSTTDKQYVQSNYPFRWVRACWRHLGVLIPLRLEDLFVANYNGLVTEATALLKKWDSDFLSWFDRLELVKSILFPKFLFFFQMLPIEITSDTLRKWQALLNSFVWKAGRPRIGFQHLNKPSSLGGFALPDLRFYYLAAQVRPIYSFLIADSTEGWRLCEQTAVTPYAIRDVIWCGKADRPPEAVTNPFLACTLKSWDCCRNTLAPGISPMSSFLGQRWFLPAWTPGSFTAWRSHGLSRLFDISS